MKYSKEDFSALIEMMPNASMNDIDSLIDNLDEVYTKKSNETKSLNDWMPSKNTVLEILRLNVKVQDLNFCLTNFKEFAEGKGWNITDNLNAKLITHIKILEQNGRIKFNIVE